MVVPLLAWMLIVSFCDCTGSAVAPSSPPAAPWFRLRRRDGPPHGAMLQQQRQQIYDHLPILRYHPDSVQEQEHGPRRYKEERRVQQEQDPSWHFPEQQQRETPSYFPGHHGQQVQDRRYQQQQVNLEQDGPPSGDATSFPFLRLPMFRHFLKPVVSPGLFRPVASNAPLPDALTSLLFPPEALPTPPTPARKPQQPTAEVWCNDDKTVTVRVDRFRLGSWASPDRFRLGSCSCSEVTPQFIYFHYKLSECQGTFTTVNGPLEYRNSLVFTPPPQGRVVRAVPLDLPIYCHYNRFHYSYKMGYIPQSDPKAYLKSIRTKRSFSLTVCDAQWRPLLPNQSFTLGERVNFVAQTGSLLVGERLYVDSCFITASKDPKNTPSLHIIAQFGCMADSKRPGSNSRFWPAEGSAVAFSVDAFMFPGFTEQLLYLHCSLSVGSVPSDSSKSCTFNTSTSRWEELEASPSVCSCCDSVCREKQIWPSYVSQAVKSLISSEGWTVVEETPGGQRFGDTIRTKTLSEQAEDTGTAETTEQPWTVQLTAEATREPLRAETTEEPRTQEMTGEDDVGKSKGLPFPRSLQKSRLTPEEGAISEESSHNEDGEEEWKRWETISGPEEETSRRRVKMLTRSQDKQQGDGGTKWTKSQGAPMTEPWTPEMTGEEDAGKSKGLPFPRSPQKSKLIPEEEAISEESSYSGDGEEEWKRWETISGAEEETTRRRVKMPTRSQDKQRGDGGTKWTKSQYSRATGRSAGLSRHTSDDSPIVRYAPAFKATELVHRLDTSGVTRTPALKSTRDATSTTASAVQYAPAYNATELVYRFNASSVSNSPALISTSTSSVVSANTSSDNSSSTSSFAQHNVTIIATTAIAGPSAISHSTSSSSNGTKGFSGRDSNGTRFDSGISNGTLNINKTMVPNVTHPDSTVLGSDQGSGGHVSVAVSGLELLASNMGSKTGTADADDIREPAATGESSGSEDLDWASFLEQGRSGPVEGIADNAPGVQLGRSVTRAGPGGLDVFESLWTKDDSELSTGTSSDASRSKVARSAGSPWINWPESDAFSDPVSSDGAVSKVLLSGTGPGHSTSTVIVTTKVVRGDMLEEDPLLWRDGELLWNQLNMEPLAEEKMEIIRGVRFPNEDKVLAKRREDTEQVERRENESERSLWFKGMRRGRAKVLEQERFRSGSESPEQREEVRPFLLGSKRPGALPDKVIQGVLVEHTDDNPWNLE